MSPAFRVTLLWLFGSLLLVLGALGMVSAAYVDGHYIPSNADAFYHARRILDVVMTHAPVVQFDTRIHAPEGSWLTWPWGFDTLLAKITSLFGPFADENAAARILMNIPVATAPMSVAFFLLLARRLQLSGLLAVVALAMFALIPANFILFAVGNVDHHFAEQLWLLMTLCAASWFFDARQRLAPGIVAGVVLGSAVAIHNGLFILQLAVVVPYAWRWLRGEPLPEKAPTRAFTASLLVCTLLACVPSQPWQRGFFEFYTLSWFHVYIAACCAALLVLLRALDNRRRNVVIATLVAAVLATPILGMTIMVTHFVSGDMESLAGVVEAYSPYRLYTLFGAEVSTKYTSWLMWIALPAWLLNVYWMVRARDVRVQVFACAGVLFLALYQFQFRFGAMGLPFLILTPLVFVQQLGERWAARRWLISAGTAAAFAVALVPTASAWQTDWAKGGDEAYEKVRGVFPALSQACHVAPGIVLASVNDGHWITYHTNCSVIGDVFLLTAQHAAKREETARLFRLTPAELVAKRPDIRYVIVHHDVTVNAPAGPGLPETPDLDVVRRRLLPLLRDLLGPRDAIPPEFQLVAEVSTPGGRAYTRAFAIVPRQSDQAH